MTLPKGEVTKLKRKTGLAKPKVWDTPAPNSDHLKRQLLAMGISTGTAKILTRIAERSVAREGCTMRWLVGLSDEYLMQQRNFGKVKLQEMRDVLGYPSDLRVILCELKWHVMGMEARLDDMHRQIQIDRRFE